MGGFVSREEVECKTPNPIDFLSGPFDYLRKKGIRSDEPLAKASGRKKKYKTLLDLTAGFGKDAFYFFCLGFQVCAIEKSKLIYSFLKEAYLKASRDAFIGPEIQKNLCFIYGNSFDYLSLMKEKERPDVIYLDPLFSETLLRKKKKALPPQSIQILRKIKRDEEHIKREEVSMGSEKDQGKHGDFRKKSGLSEKSEEEALLDLAIQKAKYRVILKRPLYAPFFLRSKLNFHQYRGKSVRYDTYFIS